MTGFRIFSVHRPWEDWLGMIIGVIIGLSPWLADQQDSQFVMWNTNIVGGLVLALAALELSGLQRWEEAGEVACGLWLVASPFVFGYAGAGQLRFWHFALGALVVLLAALEYWQDRNLNEEELARHGA